MEKICSDGAGTAKGGQVSQPQPGIKRSSCLEVREGSFLRKGDRVSPPSGWMEGTLVTF